MKNKMIAALLALSAALAGCTAASQPAAPPASSQDSPHAASEMRTVAIIQPMDHPSLNQIRETILSEFSAMGLDGTVEVVYRNANGDNSALPVIFSELVGSGVDLLIPIATGTAQSAAAATDRIPIVFSAVSNPVEAGLVEAFDRTDRNITGVSNAIAIEDIFALAGELTPGVKTFGFVYNTGEINSVTGINRARAYCDAHGIAYEEAAITGVGELQQAAQSLVGKVDAFFTPNDNSIASAMPIYLQVASEAGLPVYVGADSMVADGGLATVGINYTVLGRQTARMAARILEGETVADNPVEQVAEYARMINLDTAASLGIDLPQQLTEQFTVMKSPTQNQD